MELIAVFSPLFAFVIAGLFGRALGDRGVQWITCAAVILAAFASCVLFFDIIIDQDTRIITLSEWITAGSFEVNWTLRMDQLTAVMMVVINIVSACVHVYSVGYMAHDPHKARFMAYLSLFTFAMLMLVTADNLLQLFFGWEGVGLASYLLIGFWNEKPSANAAAVKAFVVNRVGDFGLVLGIMAIFVVFGTVQFAPIFESVDQFADTRIAVFGIDVHALTLICLLLFTGAVGKSAQLGLHTWLPDAMEGPTPVSALIHAATMVTAGVFLVARFSPVFEYAPIALQVVAIFGGLTALVAATIAMTQWDIKRVIAYSTMSQLGYMFFALGVSAYSAAMFHLMTHAFFKALLFLGAGSVIHALSNEQDMRNMGGIWRLIPFTYAFMWIGSLALAGIWPFAGFYSKDIILEAAWADQSGVGTFAFWLGIAAAFMTAFYSWRLLFLTFHGKPRANEKVMAHIHESPPTMLSPLVVLATGAILSGFVFYGGFVGSAHHGDTADIYAESDVLGHGNNGAEHDEFDSWNKEVFWDGSLFVLPENDTVEAAHSVPLWVKLLPLVTGMGGILLAYILYIYRAGASAWIAGRFRPLYRLFYNKWFFDEFYAWLFVRNSWRLGRIFSERGDRRTIDRYGPDGSAWVSRLLANGMARFQSGYVFQYAFVMMIGLIGLISWVLFRFWS